MNEPIRKKNRSYLVYFALLIVLTVAAISTLTWYNLRQQLKPEQLAAARALWKQKAPPSYILTYNVRFDENEHKDQYFVRVRNGKVVEVTFNGQALPEAKFSYYGMNRLFDYIEKFQECDQEKGKPRVFCVAHFDGYNGALYHYVRRVMGTRQRQEIKVDVLQKDE